MSAHDSWAKAQSVDVPEAQARLSKLIKSKSTYRVFTHGKPVSRLMPYEDMLHLVGTLDELQDKKIFKKSHEPERTMRNGRLFQQSVSWQFFRKNPCRLSGNDRCRAQTPCHMHSGIPAHYSRE